MHIFFYKCKFCGISLCVCVYIYVLLVEKTCKQLSQAHKISKYSIEELGVWSCLLLIPCPSGNIRWRAIIDIKNCHSWYIPSKGCQCVLPYLPILWKYIPQSPFTTRKGLISKQTAEGLLWPSKCVLTWRTVLQPTNLTIMLYRAIVILQVLVIKFCSA